MVWTLTGRPLPLLPAIEGREYRLPEDADGDPLAEQWERGRVVGLLCPKTEA